MPARRNVFNTNPFRAPLGGVTETFQPGTQPGVTDPNAAVFQACAVNITLEAHAHAATLTLVGNAKAASLSVEAHAHAAELEVSCEC